MNVLDAIGIEDNIDVAAEPIAVPPALPISGEVLQDGNRTVFAVRFPADDAHDLRKSVPVTDPQGYRWTLNFYYNGCSRHDHCSVFIELLDPRSYSPAPRVTFRFAMIDGSDIKKSHVRDALTHEFTEHNRDYGYPLFIPKAQLHAPGAAFISDANEIRISVVIENLVSRYSSQLIGSTESKLITNMVGLRNQGATCYMNSYLQTLFHLLQLRKAVYDTPTADDDSITGVALALQRTFYRLQVGKEAVRTEDLTRSFGWTSAEAYQQHDVQELSRVLMDKLEEKMKGTPVEGTVKDMFEGITRNYITCVNVDYQSLREETFQDIQLDVKGCKTIHDSFKRYVQEELLEGDNRYDAGEEHGKQDAKKGVRFLKFPPVLSIHLKRFEYDMATNNMVKVNDRFEFPFELDISEYLAEDALRDEDRPELYVLHSVLVHKGNVHGGHYYAYVRPSAEVAGGQWAKFDDESVTLVDQSEAIAGNYGYSDATPPIDPEYYWDTRRTLVGGKFCTSAYMLVYVRKSDLPDVMRSLKSDSPEETEPAEPALNGGAAAAAASEAQSSDAEEDAEFDYDAPAAAALPSNDALGEPADVTSNDVTSDDLEGIPVKLSKRFREEEAAGKKQQRDRQEAHLYCTVAVAQEKDVATCDCFIFPQNDFVEWTKCLSLRMKKRDTLLDVMKRVAKEFHVHLAQVRLWPAEGRENKTVRVDRPLQTREDLTARIEDASIEPVKLTTDLEARCMYAEIVPETALLLGRSDEPDEQQASSQASSQGSSKAAPGLDTLSESAQEELLLTGSAYAHIAENVNLMFFKHFTPGCTSEEVNGHRLMRYVGSRLIPAAATTDELADVTRQLIHVPPTAPVQLFDLVKPAATDPIELDATALGDSELGSGDIVCVQLQRPEPEAAPSQEPEVLSVQSSSTADALKESDTPQSTPLKRPLSNQSDASTDVSGDESSTGAAAHKRQRTEGPAPDSTPMAVDTAPAGAVAAAAATPQRAAAAAAAQRICRKGTWMRVLQFTSADTYRNYRRLSRRVTFQPYQEELALHLQQDSPGFRMDGGSPGVSLEFALACPLHEVAKHLVQYFDCLDDPARLRFYGAGSKTNLLQPPASPRDVIRNLLPKQSLTNVVLFEVVPYNLPPPPADPKRKQQVLEIFSYDTAVVAALRAVNSNDKLYQKARIARAITLKELAPASSPTTAAAPAAATGAAAATATGAAAATAAAATGAAAAAAAMDTSADAPANALTAEIAAAPELAASASDAMRAIYKDMDPCNLDEVLNCIRLVVTVGAEVADVLAMLSERLQLPAFTSQNGESQADTSAAAAEAGDSDSDTQQAPPQQQRRLRLIETNNEKHFTAVSEHSSFAEREDYLFDHFALKDQSPTSRRSASSFHSANSKALLLEYVPQDELDVLKTAVRSSSRYTINGSKSSSSSAKSSVPPWMPLRVAHFFLKGSPKRATPSYQGWPLLTYALCTDEAADVLQRVEQRRPDLLAALDGGRRITGRVAVLKGWGPAVYVDQIAQKKAAQAYAATLAVTPPGSPRANSPTSTAATPVADATLNGSSADSHTNGAASPLKAPAAAAAAAPAVEQRQQQQSPPPPQLPPREPCEGYPTSYLWGVLREQCPDVDIRRPAEELMTNHLPMLALERASSSDYRSSRYEQGITISGT